jgi:hypothetical protein
MTSTGQVYLKTKSIKHTFNTQVAIRNILIAITFCLVYLLGKYYHPVHISSAYGTINIKHTKHK